MAVVVVEAVIHESLFAVEQLDRLLGHADRLRHGVDLGAVVGNAFVTRMKNERKIQILAR